MNNYVDDVGVVLARSALRKKRYNSVGWSERMVSSNSAGQTLLPSSKITSILKILELQFYKLGTRPTHHSIAPFPVLQVRNKNLNPLCTSIPVLKNSKDFSDIHSLSAP